MMVNLAKNIPQKRLVLDGMKFICFVKCAKNTHEEGSDGSLRMNFLVWQSEKIVMLSLKVDPWQDMTDAEFCIQQQRLSDINLKNFFPNNVKNAALICSRQRVSQQVNRVLIV